MTNLGNILCLKLGQIVFNRLNCTVGPKSHNRDSGEPKLHNWNLVDQNRTIIISEGSKMQLSLFNISISLLKKPLVYTYSEKCPYSEKC